MTPLPDSQPALALWGIGAAIVVLLLLSALFAGAEAALSTASRGRLQGLADRGTPGAAAALALTEDRERLLGALLLGNTFVVVLAASLATLLLTRFLGAGAVAVVAVAMTALVLVFSELLPRTRAVASPEATALGLARPVGIMVALLAPVAGAARGSGSAHSRRALEPVRCTPPTAARTGRGATGCSTRSISAAGRSRR